MIGCRRFLSVAVLVRAVLAHLLGVAVAEVIWIGVLAAAAAAQAALSTHTFLVLGWEEDVVVAAAGAAEEV